MTDSRPAAGLPPVDPFPDGDPLTYEELPHDQIALRALLAVLADTGAAVRFPEHLKPSPLALSIPSGWRLQWEMRLVEAADFLEAARPVAELSARWVDHAAVLRGEVSDA
jgi:hypothetical protein